MNKVGSAISPPVGVATHYWLRGRAIGALACAAFGTWDMLSAVRDVSGGRQLWLASVVFAGGALVITAIAQRVRLSRLQKPSTDESARRRRMVYFGSRFAAIAVTEGILIGLGQPVLEHFHRVDLYPQWITAIVGVHFIPLGRLFRVGAFYLTGLALLLAALGSFLLPAGQSRGIATATGSGFSLWITTLMLLKADWRSGTGNTQGP